MLLEGNLAFDCSSSSNPQGREQPFRIKRFAGPPHPSQMIFRTAAGCPAGIAGVYTASEGNVRMKPGTLRIACVILIVLAAVPAYCQRGTLGIDVGQTADKFGNTDRTTSGEGQIDGRLIVFKGSGKEGSADVVAGGEARLPFDTKNHATELALFGGPEFRFGKGFSAGFHVQFRKAYLPATTLDSLSFARSNMTLLELPVIVEYKFGTNGRGFLQAQASPEFTPHFKRAATGPSLPNPNMDHGYSLRGTAGYNFGKWYAKASYESRYLKFSPDAGNPGGVYNWRTDVITGGIGLSF